VIAFVRPNGWDFPLLLHVLGATVLFGGLVTLLVLAFAAWRGGDQAAMLRRLGFTTTLLVVWPGWVLMRAAAQWILSREGLDDDPPGWVGVGFVVSDAGAVVLLLLTLLGWLALRRPRVAAYVAGVSGLYLVALGVAWFAMSAKPGA
jgi:hypothetical protein